MDDGDWDLQAVVRGRSLADPAVAAERDPFSFFPPSDLKAETTDGDNAALYCNFSQLLEAPTAFTELDQLYRPFLAPLWSHPSTATATAVVPAAVLSTRRPLLPPQRPQISRSKRRKNQQKRVVYQVPADGASSDLWAWRKYGQKPIKGSPYPRGYYRCSSSKGCPARKQVERSRSDPAVLVITYSSEHNHALPTHRNSLAGSTRNKFPTAAAAATVDSSPQSSITAAGLSPTTPLTASMEDEEDDEGALLVEDMEVMGEDEIVFMPNFFPPTL